MRPRRFVARVRHILAALASIALSVVASQALVASAFAHAAFVGSEPSPGVRLESSPQRVVLNFTEPLNRSLSRATLVTADGGKVRPVTMGAADKSLIVKPQSGLATGAYSVRWHTVSTDDGHALEGSFSFGVRAPAAGGVHELEQSPLARTGWLRVALRGLFYVAALLFAAGLFLPLLIRRSWLAPPMVSDGGVDAPAVRARAQGLITDVGWLAVGAAVAVTVAEAADAAGGVSIQGLSDFLLASASGVARVVVVLALTLAVVLAQRRPRVAAGAVALALLGVAASGHASSADPRGPTIVNDWLHLAAGGVWLGGLGLLVLVWWPYLRRGSNARQAAASHVLPAFGRVALPAFVLVTTTGVVSLVVQLGHLSALWSTGYGQVLLVKIGLVGLIAAASAAHAWRLRPKLLSEGSPARSERRHWRLVRSEPVVGVVVLGAVALLVAFPLPPRQLGEADEAAATEPACDPCPLPKPAANELTVADGAGSQVVAAWVRRDRAGLAGTVRTLDIQGRPSREPFTVVGARQTTCGVGCRRFRLPLATTVTVAVRESGDRFVATLPATWRQADSNRARRLLVKAQATMRHLSSLRETEEVTSGPGSFAGTEYSFQAPDRMAYRTNGDVKSVVIGDHQWSQAPGVPWTRGSFGGGIPFEFKRWFRWTTYARGVWMLNRRREGGRRVAELALMDPGTPVWVRLSVDEQTGRVLRERMVTNAHFMTRRYVGFDRPVHIEAPNVG